MELSDLLLDAIGLRGVSIERTRPDKSKLKLEIWVKQIRERCVCQKCRGPLANVKDYRSVTLRAPPIGAYREVVVHLKVNRRPTP